MKHSPNFWRWLAMPIFRSLCLFILEKNFRKCSMSCRQTFFDSRIRKKKWSYPPGWNWVFVSTTAHCSVELSLDFKCTDCIINIIMYTSLEVLFNGHSIAHLKWTIYKKRTTGLDLICWMLFWKKPTILFVFIFYFNYFISLNSSIIKKRVNITKTK